MSATYIQWGDTEQLFKGFQSPSSLLDGQTVGEIFRLA
jgi:hypothetical protein